MDMEDFAFGVVSIYNVFDDPDEGIVLQKFQPYYLIFFLVPGMMLWG